MISYGMGERSIVEIAEALEAGISVRDLTYIEGTVVRTRNLDSVYDALLLPSFEEMRRDKREYAKSFYIQYCNTDPFSGRRLAESYPGNVYVVQNPPAKPLTQMEMDDIYGLPYMRTFHPSYQALGGVPAIEEVRFSLTGSRGCFGGCSFLRYYIATRYPMPPGRRSNCRRTHPLRCPHRRFDAGGLCRGSWVCSS